jgi:hypothetical protein
MYAYIFITTERSLMRFFLIDRVSQDNGSYVCNIHNTLEKHFQHCTRAKPGWVASLQYNRPKIGTDQEFVNFDLNYYKMEPNTHIQNVNFTGEKKT